MAARPQGGSAPVDPMLAFVDAMPDGMVVSDTDGRIVLVNRMLEMLAGYGSDELLGKPLEMLVPARYRTRHVVHRADYYASGLPLPDLAPAATFASP